MFENIQWMVLFVHTVSKILNLIINFYSNVLSFKELNSAIRLRIFESSRKVQILLAAFCCYFCNLFN